MNEINLNYSPDEKEFKVYSVRMAKYLTDRGFTFSRVKPMNKNPKLSVFYYNITPELLNVATEYISEYRKNKQK